MGENMPTLEEWRRLYDAAIRVKGIAPRSSCFNALHNTSTAGPQSVYRRGDDGAPAKAGDCGLL
jgi:hypothetical protein